MIVLSKLNLKNFFVAACDVVMPRVCVVCGRSLSLRERTICLICKSDFPYSRFELNVHNRMADFYNERLSEKMPDVVIPYQYAISLMRYSTGSSYNRIVWSLKYEGNFAAGRFFSEILADKLLQAKWFSDVDLIVPVPNHPLRRWRRGYNQAEVIAKSLSEKLCVRFEPHFLLKRRYTKSQVKVGTDKRISNIEGSFIINRRFLAYLGQFNHILLVDDVFTTGATLSECHKTIRTILKNRMVRISVATIACVRN